MEKKKCTLHNGRKWCARVSSLRGSVKHADKIVIAAPRAVGSVFAEAQKIC